MADEDSKVKDYRTIDHHVAKLYQVALWAEFCEIYSSSEVSSINLDTLSFSELSTPRMKCLGV